MPLNGVGTDVVVDVAVVLLLLLPPPQAVIKMVRQSTSAMAPKIAFRRWKKLPLTRVPVTANTLSNAAGT